MSNIGSLIVQRGLRVIRQTRFLAKEAYFSVKLFLSSNISDQHIISISTTNINGVLKVYVILNRPRQAWVVLGGWRAAWHDLGAPLAVKSNPKTVFSLHCHVKNRRTNVGWHGVGSGEGVSIRILSI